MPGAPSSSAHNKTMQTKETYLITMAKLVNPALRRWRLDSQKFKRILSYLPRSCPPPGYINQYFTHTKKRENLNVDTFAVTEKRRERE